MKPTPRPLLAAAALALLLAPPQPADAAGPDDTAFLWVEAEQAARHNFPPSGENPWRAEAFWESDLLSGGDWTGMKWKSGDPQPFLEYDIDLAAAGKYSLYARKFFSFGNFRWKLDGGEWREPPPAPMHRPLDNVTMREGNERITLSWFYMGTADLTPGRHTLRVEPVLPSGAEAAKRPDLPLAYDAFVLAREPFSPSGKLRSGQKYPVREGRAFAFQPADAAPGPDAFNLRHLNESFAGEHGGIEVRDGKLVFRTDGKPARMVGVNYQLGKAVPARAFERMAASFAALGLNFIRLDIAPVIRFIKDESGAVSTRVEEETLDQCATIFRAMKRQGIYTALTWNVANSEGFRQIYLGAPAPPPPGSQPDFKNLPEPDPAPLLVFDPHLRTLVRDAWDRVLQTETSDGLSLATDPALFLVTLGQQSSLLNDRPLTWDALTPAAREAMAAAWRDWAAAKFGSTKKAAETWSVGDNDAFAHVPSLAEIPSPPDAIHRDALRFLAAAQADFISAAAAHLRQTGYRGLVSGGNKSNGRPEILGLADILSRMPGDVIERHGFLRGTFVPKYDLWNFTEGTIFADRSPVRLDAAQNLEAARFELPLKAPAFPGKPSLLTEIGVALPNRFAGEMPLVTFLLSSLQDVQAVAFATLTTENWAGSLNSARSQVFTPAILGQMPALALAFREGLLPGPVKAGRIELDKDTPFSLQAAAFPEAPNTQIDAPVEIPQPPAADNAPPPQLWLTGAIEVRPDAARTSFRATGDGALHEDGSLETAGSSVRWTPDRHLLVVDAPSFQAATGALRDAGTIRLGALEIRSPMKNGVVCAVALDGQPLDFSRRMLVQVFSSESNTGFFAQPAGALLAVRSTGRPPLVLEEISGDITFLRPDADDLSATALDDNLEPLLPAGLGASLRLLPSTRYYLIEK